MAISEFLYPSMELTNWDQIRATLRCHDPNDAQKNRTNSGSYQGIYSSFYLKLTINLKLKINLLRCILKSPSASSRHCVAVLESIYAI